MGFSRVSYILICDLGGHGGPSESFSGTFPSSFPVNEITGFPEVPWVDYYLISKSLVIKAAQGVQTCFTMVYILFLELPENCMFTSMKGSSVPKRDLVLFEQPFVGFQGTVCL